VKFLIEDPHGSERAEQASKLPRAKKIARQIYRDAFPDVWPWVELYFSTRRDGTIDLVVDNGAEAYATGITIRKG
jgi:hypothetical protein